MCAEYFNIPIQQATTKSRVQVKDKNYERFSLNCLETQQKVLMSFACFALSILSEKLTSCFIPADLQQAVSIGLSSLHICMCM